MTVEPKLTQHLKQINTLFDMANYKQTMPMTTTIAQTASMDIPKPRNSGSFTGRDTFAAVAARSNSPVNHHPNDTPHHRHRHQHQHQPGCMLPTPPNSISPCLPPQRYLAHEPQPGVGHPPTPHALDSDVDHIPEQNSHDGDGDGRKDESTMGRGNRESTVGRGHATASTDPDAPGDSSSEVDVTGVITPALLAKHHLPNILLMHGPLAIRHVMSYLTISVPGFSQIPSAKARRLVVAALEGRGADGEKRFHHGEVVFEKVGWGRWDARMKGQAPRNDRHHHQQHTEYSPPASYTRSNGHDLRQASPDADHHRPQQLLRPMDNRISAGASWTEDSVVYSHEDEDGMDFMGAGNNNNNPTMLEHEADKMSLDGQSSSCSSPPVSSASPEPGEDEEGELGMNEEDDATDDEDWAKIGAAALRQASLLQADGRRRGSTSGHGFPVRVMRERRLQQQQQGGWQREGRGGGGGLTHSYQPPLTTKITTSTTPYSIPGNEGRGLYSRPGGGVVRGVTPHSMNRAKVAVGGVVTRGGIKRKNNHDDDDVMNSNDEMMISAENNNTQEREAIEALVALSSF
ncbi:MAG: hypothetical protein M1823_003167 [Watsoniomyces obsoletus]|nr:MAG: hypothetical protein M1823_003167 [Watsoniomyces obsoletus]